MAKTSTFAPVPKIAAVGSAGIAAVALIWYARNVFGVDMPTDVATATVAGVTFAAGWLRSNETVREILDRLFVRNDPKRGRHAS